MAKTLTSISRAVAQEVIALKDEWDRAVAAKDPEWLARVQARVKTLAPESHRANADLRVVLPPSCHN